MKGMTNRQQGFFIFLVVLAGATGTGGLPHGRDDWMAYLLLAFSAVPLALFYRRFSGHPPLVQLRGLDAQKVYTVVETGEQYTGDELMNLGLCVRLPWGDAASVSLTLKAE